MDKWDIMFERAYQDFAWFENDVTKKELAKALYLRGINDGLKLAKEEVTEVLGERE